MKESDYKQLDALMDDTMKASDLITEHLAASGDDLTLLILRGHLVTEQILEIILARLLGVAELPKGRESLGFRKKLKLVEAVVCERAPGPNADRLLELNALNEARNALAHNLTSAARVEKIVRDYLNGQHDSKKGKGNLSLADRLRVRLIELCGFLLAVRKHLSRD